MTPEETQDKTYHFSIGNKRNLTFTFTKQTTKEKKIQVQPSFTT